MISEYKLERQREDLNLKEIESHMNSSDISEKNIDIRKGFTHSCKCGRLDIAQWLWKTYDHDEFVPRWGFMGACANNHLVIAKWLWEEAEEEIEFESYDYGIMEHICRGNAFDELCKYPVDELAKVIDDGLVFGEDTVLKFLWEKIHKSGLASPILLYAENGRCEYLVYLPEYSNKWFRAFKGNDNIWVKIYNPNGGMIITDVAVLDKLNEYYSS